MKLPWSKKQPANPQPVGTPAARSMPAPVPEIVLAPATASDNATAPHPADPQPVNDAFPPASAPPAPMMTADAVTEPVPSGKTWTVSHISGEADFVTITEAIDAAADGDTIEIAVGTYTESLQVDTSLHYGRDGSSVGTC